jgi:hypothetical protein
MNQPAKSHFLRYLETRGIRLTDKGLVESVAPFVSVEPYQGCIQSASPTSLYTPEERAFADELEKGWEKGWVKCWLKPSAQDPDDSPWHYTLQGVLYPFGPEFMAVSGDNELVLCRVPSPTRDGNYMSDIRKAKFYSFYENIQTLRQAGLLMLSGMVAGT